MPREQRHDANQPVTDNQWMSRERDHSLTLGPFLIADSRVSNHLVRQMWLSLFRDHADFEFAHGDSTVRPIEVRIKARARLQFQHVASLGDGPDTSKRGTEMFNESLGAALQCLLHAHASPWIMLGCLLLAATSMGTFFVAYSPMRKTSFPARRPGLVVG